MTLRYICLLSVGLLLLKLPDANAILMRPLAVDELARRADLIIQGTVLDQTALRDSAGRIYTKVNVHVGEIWKGALPTNAVPDVLTIVHGGGTVGNVREEVAGDVQYAPGEEFVAFLVFNPQGEPVTIGLAQGKFHVWRDRQTGKKFTNNLYHGESEPASSNAADVTAPLPVIELKKQVQRTIP